jgi:hypothetical protein
VDQDHPHNADSVLIDDLLFSGRKALISSGSVFSMVGKFFGSHLTSQAVSAVPQRPAYATRCDAAEHAERAAFPDTAA